METNTPKSTIGKQLLGGVMGMGIAAGFYFAMTNWPGSGSLSALLVDTPAVITPNANLARVRVNDKNVDDDKLRLIASRARLVAAQLGTAVTEFSENESKPTIASNAEVRLETRRRRFTADGTPVALAIPASNPFASEPTHGGAPLNTMTAKPAPVVADAPATPTSTALPSSGFGTTVLMILALLGTVSVMQRKILGRA